MHLPYISKLSAITSTSAILATARIANRFRIRKSAILQAKRLPDFLIADNGGGYQKKNLARLRLDLNF